MNAHIRIQRKAELTAMKANGHYDQNCSPQAKVGSVLAEILREEARSCSQSGPNFRSSDSPFRIVDYGCSTGRNSIELFAPAISTLWKRYPKLSVHAVRCDLPSNDFNQLAKNSQTLYLGNDRNNYFESMIARSFNDQLLPNNQVDLSVCSLALHWVENLNVCSPSISPEFTDQEYIFAQRWERQLAKFLQHRSRELRSRGSLTMAHLTKSMRERQKHGPFRLLDEAFQLLDVEKPADCVLPIYRPTHRQFVHKLGQVLGHGLQVTRSFELNHQNPLFVEYENRQNKKLLARKYVDFVMAFASPTITLYLDVLRITINDLSEAMVKLVVANPHHYEPQNSYSIVQVSA